jgi:hypothetical protein
MDNGYKAAQRAYDNQLPPDSDEYLIDCPKCVAGLDDNGDVCEECKGEGCLAVTKHEYVKWKTLQEDEAREEEGGPNDF